MMRNVTTNWSVLLDTKVNRSHVQEFVDGSSLRSLVSEFKSDEARAELYKLERYLPANVARDRARRALSRRSK